MSEHSHFEPAPFFEAGPITDSERKARIRNSLSIQLLYLRELPVSPEIEIAIQRLDDCLGWIDQSLGIRATNIRTKDGPVIAGAGSPLSDPAYVNPSNEFDRSAAILDQFAGNALAGIIAATAHRQSLPRVAYAAEEAYKFGRAMLDERKKQRP